MLKIGVDIIENDRVTKIFDRFGNLFADKILTESEKEIFLSKKDKVKYLASRWAGKEAVGKALGCGLSCGIKNIEILNYENGQPYINLYNEALKQFTSNKCTSLEISLSHEKNYSVAFVITL